ncbi:hypothetical protein [Halorubrum sp. PV6]|nr:hypothetical protein [Halorubrum sp. PV6]
MSGKEVGGIMGLLALYFVFDLFIWNGGILNPSILSRIANVGVITPF